MKIKVSFLIAGALLLFGTSASVASHTAQSEVAPTFTKITTGAIVNDLRRSFPHSVWADFNNDGFLDLFVCNLGSPSNSGARNSLWHNNGGGSFTKITSGAIATDVTAGWGTLWADYDNDGFMDLLVINASVGPNYLYHNGRDGKFTSILTNAVGADTWAGGTQGGAWGDYDNDGFQ